MYCNQANHAACKGHQFNLATFGVCDTDTITINGADRTQLNWNEISVPEILPVPAVKPDIEHLDQVFVNARLNCAKLIETPFAYKTYDRAATTFEIDAISAAIDLAVVDIAPIVAEVNAILAIPNLPAIPAVAGLQAALAAVVAADANLTTVIASAQTALAAPCLVAAALTAIIESVIQAISLLQKALNALSLAGAALVTATAGIPIVGLAVAAAVLLLDAAIAVVVGLLDTAVLALKAAITLVGNTKYFALAENEEGTCLSGRKIIVDGFLNQKVVYTGLVDRQSVHSFSSEIPFTAYIIPYAKFVGLTYEENVLVIDDVEACTTTTINGFAFNPDEPIVVDLCEEFAVQSCIEDIFAYAMDTRTVFKNITLFLQATPATPCI